MATQARPRLDEVVTNGGDPQQCMWFSISPHSAYQLNQAAIETLLTTIHQAARGHVVTLVIAGMPDGMMLLAEIPTPLTSLFRAAAADLLPECKVDACDEPVTGSQPFRRKAVLQLRPEFLMLAEADGFDRLSGLFSGLRTGKAGRVQAQFSIGLRPVSPKRRRQTEKMIQHSAWKLRYFDALYKRLVEQRTRTGNVAAVLMRRVLPCRRRPADETKLQSHLFECEQCVEVSGPVNAKRLIETKLVDVIGSLGAFTTDRCRFKVVALSGKLKCWKKTSVLTPRELAMLWHPPSGQTRVARVAKSPILELETPAVFSSERDNNATVIGKATYRNQKQLVTLSPDDRMRHLFVIGKTGCGKSTLLQNMIVGDMQAGRAVCLIDPHGDLTESLLDHVPRKRTNNVVLFDAGDRDYPIGFNPLATGGKLDPILVADGVLVAFEKVFGLDAGQAPRLLHIFRNCLLALVTAEDKWTLLHVQRMLVDKPFRDHVVGQVDNPVVRQFWMEEFGRWRPQDRTAFVASLQNKLGAYLSNPLLTGILGQTSSSVNFRSLMDDGRKIVLVNLSKGRVGGDAGSLLGALLVSAIQTAALSRADIDERDRKLFYVYLDEFSSFVSEGNDTFASILSESRKYKTGYTLVTQFVDQLDSQTRAAVFGNCGSIIAMQSGIDDAQVLAGQLGSRIDPQAITDLPRFHAYARTHVDSTPTPPFALKTLPPPKRKMNRCEVVRKNSRLRHAKPRAAVESQINAQFT